MDFRQCRECGKMFSYLRNPYCPECRDRIDQMLVAIRDYLEERPEAGIRDITERLDIPERFVLHLIREGRVTFRDAPLLCERCHIPIDSGRFCGACVRKFRDAMEPDGPHTAETKDQTNTENTDRPGGMHIKRRNRRS